MSPIFLEACSRLAWPFLRKLTGVSKRCSQCILSEKHGPLTGGLCQACAAPPVSMGLVIPNAEEQPSSETQSRFRSTVLGFIQPRPYHAVLLLSGGKDSAYILHRLRREYPALKLLCVYVENGFSSPVAQSNAAFVANKYGADLFVCNSKIPEFASAFRGAFLNLNGRGASEVVDFADGQLIFQIGQAIAQEMSIPLVLSGLTWVQVQRLTGSLDFQITQETAPRMVFPLAAWRVGEQEIREFVKAHKLVPFGNSHPIASNNTLVLTMAALDILKRGYCSFEPEFAQLIREQKANRKPWLYLFEILEFCANNGLLRKEVNQALARMDLRLEDVLGNGK